MTSALIIEIVHKIASFMFINVYCLILSEILSKCIAFLISSLHINTDKDRILKKLKHLKSLVSRCHNYTNETVNDIVKELMTALKGKYIFRIMFFFYELY